MNNNNDNTTSEYALNNIMKDFIVIIESTFNNEHKDYKNGDLKKFLMNLKILAIESSINNTKLKNSNFLSQSMLNTNFVFDDNTFNYFSEIMQKLFEYYNRNEESVWIEILTFMFNIIINNNLPQHLVNTVLNFQHTLIVMFINNLKTIEKYSFNLIDFFISNIYSFIMKFEYFHLLQNEIIFVFLFSYYNDLCLETNLNGKKENTLKNILELFKYFLCLKEDNKNETVINDENDVMDNDENTNTNEVINNHIKTKSSIISLYIKSGGLESLFNILQNNYAKFNIIKNISSMIHELATSLFKESAIIFLNYSYLKNFVMKFKSIVIYSSKKINDSIYLELMNYMKNIMKNCDLTVLCEETNLIEYFLTEVNDIYNTVRSFSYKTLQFLYDICQYIAQYELLVTSLIVHSKFNQFFKNTLILYTDKEEIKNNNSFKAFLSILIEAFKNKTSADELYSKKDFLIKCNRILLSNFNIIQEKFKVMEYFRCIIQYEKELTNNTKKLIDIDFINSLVNSLNRNYNEAINSALENCLLLLIENQSNGLQKNVSKETDELLHDVSVILPQKNKYARRVVVTKKNSSSNTKTDQNQENEIAILFERTMLQFNCTLNSITDILKGKFNQNIPQFQNLSVELNKLIKILFHLIKNKNVFDNVYDSNVILKLLTIISNNPKKIPEPIYSKTYNFICKISTVDLFMDRMLEDAKMCDYFLKEFFDLIKNNEKFLQFLPLKDFDICRINAITKMISELSKYDSFIVHNQNILNEENLIDFLNLLLPYKNILPEIIVNILKLFHIIIDKNKCEHKYSSIGKVLMQIWNNFSNEKQIVVEIINIIHICYVDKDFLRTIIENNLAHKIKLFLENNKTDGDTLFACLTCVELLMSQSNFLSVTMQGQLLNPIIFWSNKQIFNSKLIEKLLEFIEIILNNSKLSLSSLGKQINNLCLEIFNKYSKTSNTKIISADIQILIRLIKDNENFKFFSKINAFNTLIQSIYNERKIQSLSLISLQLLSEITSQLAILVKGIIKQKQNDSKESIKNEIILVCGGYMYEQLFLFLLETFLQNDNDYELLFEICSVLINCFQLYDKHTVCKVLFEIGIQSLNANNIGNFELVIQKIKEIITIDYHNDMEFKEFLIFLNTVVKFEYIQKQLLREFIKLILMFIKKYATVQNISWVEVIKALVILEKEICKETDVINFCKILFILVQNNLLKSQSIPLKFLLKIMGYIINKKNEEDKMKISINNKEVDFIEIIKMVSSFTSYETNIDGFEINTENIRNIVEDLIVLFNLYKLKGKKFIHVLDIILFFITISKEINGYIVNQTSLLKEMKNMIRNSNYDDPSIKSQIKGCILNLESTNHQSGHRDTTVSKKGKKLNTDNLINLNDKIIFNLPFENQATPIAFSNIDHEMYQFLSAETDVKIYTDNGHVKHVSIKFLCKDNNFMVFDKIIATETKKNSIYQEMKLSEMESCIRSASASAFHKVKGLFKKKPKPTHCFSILGYKILNQKQKTFNIECQDENTCIKFVDYISKLILDENKSQNINETMY